MNVVLLGDVADYVNGAAFKGSDWDGCGRRIIRIQNLNDASKPFNRTSKEVKDSVLVRPGDLLVSWSASLGVYEWEGPDEAVLNQHIFRVVPNSDVVDKRYLRWVLEWSLVRLERQVHGATMKHLTRGKFLDTEIPLPPIEEQRRIAAVLDAADALRAKRREAIAKLDTLTQAIFIDMFGDPEFTVADLADVAEVQGGLQVSSKRSVNPIEVPYLRVANVYRGFLDLGEIKMLHVTQKELNRTRLVPGDLLVVEGHGNPSEIGRVGQWDGSIDPCVHQNHLIRVRCDTGLVEPTYVEVFLNSRKGRRALLRAANTTSGLNTISTGDVRTVALPIPGLIEQRRFVAAAESAVQRRRSLADHQRKLDTLFSSLQQRAFRGEL